MNKILGKVIFGLGVIGGLLWLLSNSMVVSEAAQTESTATVSPPPTVISGAENTLALPDLITLPPAELELNQNADLSWRVVRFDNTIANIGEGPLEVVGEPAGAGTYRVRQRFFTSNGELALEPLLTELRYHSEHSHWHLDEFARYELWSTNADQTLRDVVDVNSKVSYCLMDTEKGQLGPDAPRGYTLCSPSKQGISAGWMDTYNSHFPGQVLNLSGLPDGIYAIRSLVDPDGNLREADTTNNEAITYFHLTRFSIEELPTPGLVWSWDRSGLVIPFDLLN